MPTPGTPGGGAGPPKLPQVRKDFNLAAAKPAAKPPAPRLNLNTPKPVAVAAPRPGGGVPMVGPPAAKIRARIAPPPPKPTAAFNRAAQPGLKPAFRQAAKPPTPVKTPAKVS